jgi:catechol 2,3-dioxygenase-like lactoylglutathione lyase family enzyme
MVRHRPVLDQIDLVARDFDASRAFYRRLGVELPEQPIGADGIGHATAEWPGMELAIDNEKLARVYNAAWRRGAGSRALIGFRVETRAAVDEIYADLVDAGYEGRQQPYDAFWGARYAVVADPDGNDVGIMSPSDDAHRSWPPKDSPG